MAKVSEKSTNSVRIVSIDEASAEQRIDNFLLKTLKGVPKSRIYRILRKGEVRVNKGRIRPEYRLKCGDQVRIPPVRTADRAPQQAPDKDNLNWLEERIIFEDESILVLNKPAGLAVHGGSGLKYGAIECMRELRKDAHFLELVHRLDRDTSGCLMFAKRRSHLRRLHEQLREGRIEKHYRALLKGKWRGGTQKISCGLEKNTLSSGERVVRVSDSGKQSESIFKPIDTTAIASYMDIHLLTGRTHQIRVHAASEGYPLAGDTKYGDKSFNQEMKQLGLKRQFLHAWSLSLTHPKTGEPLNLTATLDDDLQQVLSKLF